MKMAAIAFDNSYARLPERFFSRRLPTPVAQPGPIRVNHALAALLGIDPLWLESPAGTAVLAGNATVRDMVASGAYAWGLTDTDDANGAVEDGLPARWQFPDQEQDGLGTLVIPNTVAVVKHAPHPEAARKLVDYLLEPDVERALAEMRGMQIPLNPAVDRIVALAAFRPPTLCTTSRNVKVKG